MNEDGATVQFTVHREDLGGACTNSATVTVRLKSAGEGELRASLDDYTFSDSVIGSQGPDPDSCLLDLDFAPDQSTRTITVSAIDDANAEPEEWLKLVLLYANLAGDPAQPVPLSATLPTQVFAGIIDNDTPLYAPYKLWVTGPQDAALNENAGQATYTLHRQIEYPWAQPYAIEVALDADQNGAIPGQDFDASGIYCLLAQFAAEQDQVEFTLTAIDNAAAGPNDPIILQIVPRNLVAGSYYFSTADPDFPSTINATILDNEPAPAPGNLSASPFSDTAVTLAWTDNSPNETAFILEKSTDGGANWSTVKVVDPETNSTSIDNLHPGRTYQFRASAQNANAATQSDSTPAAKSNTLPDTQSQIDFLESLNIPVDGSTVTSTITLEHGVEYQLTARGGAWIDQTYYPDPGIYGYTGDAEYATGNDTVGSGQTEDALFATDVGINVSGAQETDIHWGQHNPAGTYTIHLTGTGQPLTLHYRLPSQADPYPDPSAYNTLAVDISRITPIVSVEVTDPDASEDNQDPAVFTFTRTGSTSRDLTVYYTLDGTATPGTLDEEGNPSPEEADYTGPVADSEHEGLYKITLSAGQTSKTLECIPLNDALDESDEIIIVSIVDAPEDAPSNGLYAPPTTQPGNAAVNKNLNVSSVSGTDWGDKDANKPTDAQLNEQVGKLADANARQGAITTLKNMIKDYPSIEPYLDQKITGENNPDVVGALYDILASKFAATVTQDSTNPNQLNVTFRKPPDIVGVAKWSVTIRPENPGLLKMNAQQGAGEVVIAGPDSISIDLSLNNLATPSIAVTTLDKRQTTLVVGWVALKQKPDQTFEPVEESRGTRWYQIKLGNAAGN